MEIISRISPLVKFDLNKISPIPKELWNIMLRFRKSLLSGSFSDQFEALVGTIDSLGKLLYGGPVGSRMKKYMVKVLNIEDSKASIIIQKRNYKIHENSIDNNIKNVFFEIRDLVLKDIAVRAGIQLKKPTLIKIAEARIVMTKK